VSAFAEAAVRLAGLAALRLGWPPDIFWNATPAELAAIVRAGAEDAPEPVDARALRALLEENPDG
jgi:uncharacterized phage protein (TIGR02216 family)